MSSGRRRTWRSCYNALASHGGIAQLGERDAGSVEARGSSPLTSTLRDVEGAGAGWLTPGARTLFLLSKGRVAMSGSEWERSRKKLWRIMAILIALLIVATILARVFGAPRVHSGFLPTSLFSCGDFPAVNQLALLFSVPCAF